MERHGYGVLHRRTKFEVSSFNRSRDIAGVPKFPNCVKFSTQIDHKQNYRTDAKLGQMGHEEATPFEQFCIFLIVLLVFSLLAKFKVSS